jgi:hypothetical protein
MICRKCKNLFSAYLDNDLKAQERRRFEDHLAECEDCAKAFNDFRQVVELTTDLSVLQPSANFDRVLRAKMTDGESVEGRGWLFSYRSVVLIGAACLLLIVVAFGTYMYKSGRTDHQDRKGPAQIAIGREVIPMMSSHAHENIFTNFVMPSVPSILISEQDMEDTDMATSEDYRETRTFVLPSVTGRYTTIKGKPGTNYVIKPVSLISASDEIGF